MNRNYSKELDKKIEGFVREGRRPTLLLHACCAPCSSYCLEYLSKYFDITVFFYNPNITSKAEYVKRIEEIKRFIVSMDFENPVKLIEGSYEPEKFYEVSRGLEKEPERGARCTEYFTLRLGETARLAARMGFELFTTTLTISPLKNASLLNEIGQAMAEKYGSSFLNSDFKKKNGYKRSIELSAEYDLYRQDYCGCIYSKLERENQKKDLD